MEVINEKIVFMTGATSGLGKAASCELADKGAKVFAMVRNDHKGKQLIEYYTSEYKEHKGSLELIKGNLNDLSSVVSMCEELISKTDRLDIIINNAGIMNFKFAESIDGIEETLQVNLLAPVLITHLLAHLLIESDDPKVIYTASALHQGTIRFKDIEFRKGFSSFKSYKQSKLGIILMTRLFAKDLSSYGISVFAQHPGFVSTSLGDRAGFISRLIFRLFGKSPEDGAVNLLYLCNTPSNHLSNGEYYADQNVKEITKESYDLVLAHKLKQTIEGYLKTFIKNEGIIFDEETIND